MAELSRAAAALLRAAGDSEPGIYATIAATLQAAAQLNPGPFVPELFGDGWKAAMGELESIAAEIDGINHTSEETFDD
jgi:hypothetical protein